MVTTRRPLEHVRRAAVVLFAVVLPSWGWARGDGAFTMYARAEEYRLRIVAIDAAGRARGVPPTALAPRVGPTASHYFAGAEHATRAPDVAALRARLGAVALLSCDVSRDLGQEPVRIRVELWEKPIESQDERVASEERACASR